MTVIYEVITVRNQPKLTQKPAKWIWNNLSESQKMCLAYYMRTNIHADESCEHQRISLCDHQMRKDEANYKSKSMAFSKIDRERTEQV